MNRTKNFKIVVLFLILSISSVLLVGGAVLAKNSVQATEPDGEPAEYMAPSYDNANPSEALPPDENHPASVQGTSVTFSYYQVSGATLRGRNSTTGYAYDSFGCSHVTAAADMWGRILNTELPIPDGSVIKYLRVYYKDLNAANGVEGYITRYQPGVEAIDLIHVGSTNAYVGGYNFVVSAEITETVNNTQFIYTLIGWPDAVSVNNQICGLRVAYYAPRYGLVFLPALTR